MSDSEYLALIDAAIKALLLGNHSSYSIGARTVTRLDLDSLREERRYLTEKIAAESGSRPLVGYSNINPRGRSC